MADNPYAGLWDVSLDAEALHREVQRHVDAAVLDFATGIFTETDLTGDGDISVYPFQTRYWAEGVIDSADVLTLTGILKTRIHECTYGDENKNIRLDRDDVEPLFKMLEAIIAEARSRYAPEESDV